MRFKPRPAVRRRASPAPSPSGQWGYGVETSRGKDTPSGHWEIAGTPVDFDWGYFPETIPAFPEALTASLIKEGKLPGILANRHASGTAIIEEFGEEHVRTGKPICYTSANSVLQIAAHEEAFGLERLYELCRIGRRLCDPLKIGRVIARPFVGESAKDFVRTSNRKDFAVPPPDGNLLQRAARAGRAIVSIGKIGDIFAHRDTGTEVKGKSNDGNVDLLLEALKTRPTAGSSSSISSTSTPNTAIAATCPASPPASRLSMRGSPRSRPRCAGGLLPDHRRSRQRPDLQRLRPHPRARADPRLRRACACRPDRRPLKPRRHRRDDRRQARPAEGIAWAGVAGMSFALDERLAKDTFVVGDMPLCRVLLMNNSRWPWLILVPRREGAVELTDLDAARPRGSDRRGALRPRHSSRRTRAR